MEAEFELANKAKFETDLIPKAELIVLLRDKVKEIGPGKVSKHCSSQLHVYDMDPFSLRTGEADFRKALEWAKETGVIKNFICPPKDPAFHIEVEK